MRNTTAIDTDVYKGNGFLKSFWDSINTLKSSLSQRDIAEILSMNRDPFIEDLNSTIVIDASKYSIKGTSFVFNFGIRKTFDRITNSQIEREHGAALYNELFKGLELIRNKLYPERPRRNELDCNALLEPLLKKYIKSFYNSDSLTNSVINLMEIFSFDNENNKHKEDNKKVFQNMLSAVMRLKTSYTSSQIKDSTIRKETKNDTRQTGGDIEERSHILKLSSLLRNISYVAAGFVESFMYVDPYERDPQPILRLNDLIDKLELESVLPSVIITAQRIRWMWSRQLSMIRDSSKNVHNLKCTAIEESVTRIMLEIEQMSEEFDKEMRDDYLDSTGESVVYTEIPITMTNRNHINQIATIFSQIEIGDTVTKHINPAVIVLILFTMIDNTMQRSKQKEGRFFNPKIILNNFETPDQWFELHEYLIVYMRSIFHGYRFKTVEIKKMIKSELLTLIQR